MKNKSLSLIINCQDNKYRSSNHQMFDLLKELVERNPKNYHHELKASNKYKDLLVWIEKAVPLLNNNFYKLSTKCAWILLGIYDFPKCQTCRHVFIDKNISIRKGYPKFCSAKCNCSNKETISKSQTTKLIKYGDKGWNNPEKSRATRYSQNNGKWEKPDTDTKRKATNLKHCGFEYSLQSPVCKEKSKKTNLEHHGVEYPAQNPVIISKSVATKNLKYGNGRGDPSHFTYVPTAEQYKKSAETCLERYGVTNGGASKEAQLKIHAKYFYNNKHFDSAPELAFEIWLNDNNIIHSYRDGNYIEYAYDYNNKKYKSRYYYDFKLSCGLIIEIKGRHLLDENMKLINPYARAAYEKGKMPKEKYEKTVIKYNAKQLCIEKNHVIVLTNSDYEFYENYITEKYGKNYLTQFRNAKS